MMEVLQILHLHFVCIGTVSHKFSSWSHHDLSYDLSRPTTSDLVVV